MALEVGQAAPAFKALNQNGEEVTLEGLKGKKVVLYFYPKDDTPGCTKQSCNLRDNYQTLIDAGYVVLGVSIDNEKSHQKFISKYDLPFDLLVDTEKELVEAFGVWVEKKMYGRTYWGTQRTTFVIDEEGKISEIISKVKTDDHTAQVIGAEA